MDSSVARVVAYFGELASLASETAIEDHLLVTPKLDASILAHSEVQALLGRGLASPSIAIRSFCLTKALTKIEPGGFSDALWHSVLSLVRDPDVGVSQRAIVLAASHASAARLSGPLQVLVELQQESLMGELRVLEFVVKVVTQHEELVRVAFVAKELERLYSLAVDDNVDTLTQLSALELLSAELLGCDWGRNAVLEAKLIERASTRAQNADVSISPGLLRFVGNVVACCDERGLERLQSGTRALSLAVSALDDPSRTPELVLDACLCLVEGVSKSCDSGRRLLCENKLLAAIVDHVRSGDVYVRVRCSHALADVLSTLDGSVGPEARVAVIQAVEQAGGEVLVARLMHLASQPLLTEQRTAVFRLLAVLIKHLPEYSFKSCPTLFAFIINRSADPEKDALQWRYVMVQAAFAAKELFSAAQIGLLTKYLQQGAFYKEHRADVKNEAN